jgi:hypothetical protein
MVGRGTEIFVGHEALDENHIGLKLKIHSSPFKSSSDLFQLEAEEQ